MDLTTAFRQAWKSKTVRLSIALAISTLVYQLIPQIILPLWAETLALLTFSVLGVVLRFMTTMPIEDK